ncbi:MAG: CRTAC1 family protein [Isosphaeraceae bacterium]
MSSAPRRPVSSAVKLLLGLLLATSAIVAALTYSRGSAALRRARKAKIAYQPRKAMDTGGFTALLPRLAPWPPTASLLEVSNSFRGAGHANIAQLDKILAHPEVPDERKIVYLLMKAALYNYEAEPARALEVLEQTRSWLEGRDAVAAQWLYSVIYFQGVTALRRGENDNCIACRGESSCIFPISPAAVHTNPYGSRLAIKHFTEYLDEFSDDLGVRWLLTLAHMTLAEYPRQVDPRFLIPLEGFCEPQFDIGRFRDVGHSVGVDRFNQAGGAIMDDFDGDGLLDLAVTSLDPTMAMAFYQNRGDGTFEDRSEPAGVAGQLGGLVCYQTDYNNDGRLDIFIPRGAWFPFAIRPSLLRNDGGRFSDVTAEAGLLDPVNSNAAAWSDYDNDGWLDLFIACEKQPNRLYHNRRDGTFEEVAARAGVDGKDQEFYKGCAWIDFDNDRFPDLFVNCMSGLARLYRNNRDGTFSNVSGDLEIDGPRGGFSCWAWDYDNDGWLDIFATSYDRSLNDVVRGILGQTHRRCSNRLFHNRQGTRFEDKTAEAGLDMVFAAMGSNFGDFDNDGFLDMYLGTGDTDPGTLVPNRMFKNLAGRRFAEITVSSGTGHLQKGHAVSCADWDNDGDLDIFIEMGGAINGDKYHNILFQNPGQGNNWLKLKLVGRQTNRAAIGARIKVVTAGEHPLTIHRHISSGSSFGANPLEQTIGLARANRVALLEIAWPASGTTQVFRDIPANRSIEVTEFAAEFRTLAVKVVPQPE